MEGEEAEDFDYISNINLINSILCFIVILASGIGFWFYYLCLWSLLVIEDVQFITSSLYFLSLHSVLFCLFFPCLSFCGHFICLSSCLCVSDFLFYFSDPCSVCLVFSFTFLSFIFPDEFQLCCQVCLLSLITCCGFTALVCPQPFSHPKTPWVVCLL